MHWKALAANLAHVKKTSKSQSEKSSIKWKYHCEPWGHTFSSFCLATAWMLSGNVWTWTWPARNGLTAPTRQVVRTHWSSRGQELKQRHTTPYSAINHKLLHALCKNLKCSTDCIFWNPCINLMHLFYFGRFLNHSLSVAIIFAFNVKALEKNIVISGSENLYLNRSF